MSIQDKITEIEEEIARTQKNKATERHIGHLKARISRLKLSMDEKKGKTVAPRDTFDVIRSGDARVALIGFPSVGKSTLFSKITNTQSKIAEHEFTTVDVIAGQLRIEESIIQLLDLPGIITGAASNKGRGKQVISVARTCNLIVMILTKEEEKELLVNELNEMGIRINRTKPRISINQTTAGGININSLEKNNEEMIKFILKEFKINNCLVTIQDRITDEDMIDAITKRAVYMDCIFVYNKVDNLSLEEIKRIDGVSISSEKGWNFDTLKDVIWRTLSLKRIYTKKKGEFPDLDTPVIIRKDGKISDLCKKIHKDFIKKFKSCLVWGRSVKHLPQRVGLGHVLSDEDVVQIYIN
ncbi:small GTP-binding protein domain [Vavraia culicis subsp. floridensis]|uniref:Small GTP-binding protein domain n=1 Tax=Vavraia culicis (isolate floridensis) TaxID=948595 RepID=L2GVF8_VAVCU|nr:small GTP-binding protein domain [Vavraia culicis subsp. floridensis]ELA47656.1 small GTP-binding protein domain [Vavraia culicis subsp. floridensis]